MEECCEQEPAGSHRCDSGCTVVEDGGLKTECAKVLPVPPNTFAIVQDLARAEVSADHAFFPAVPPFESAFLPQFVIQTALPIRAPSLTS